MKILCLGNSITLHGPKADIGWTWNHGMAASAPEKDYVHRLSAMLEEAGRKVELRFDNISGAEVHPETFELSSLDRFIALDPDVVVLRICENVPGEKIDAFAVVYEQIIRTFLASGHTAVLAGGAFWRNDRADELMKQAAERTGAIWVPMTHLHDQQYQAIGQFEHAGVAAHPSDFGMEKIAETLFSAMQNAGLVDGTTIPAFPEGEDSYEGYSVTVNGKAAICSACRVSAMSFNRVWPGQQRPIEQTERAAFLSFELDSGSADVAVTADHDFTEATVRPLSKKLAPTVSGRTVTFTVREPGQYTVELDGRHHTLHLFVNPPDPFAAEKETAAYYFAPGIHEAGDLKLRSGETLYIDAGAVVHASVSAEDAENVRILGRGILDNSRFPRGGHRPVVFSRCRNVTMEGVVIRDSSEWTVTSFNCVGMEFRNVKAIGMWRYNSDGFDFVNSQQVHVADCFLRCFDDVIVLKGLYRADRAWEKMNLTDYLIERCVLWCDWGGAMELGAETVADEYERITFRDCDILRNDQGGLRIHSGDRAFIHDLHYENIRVEYSKYDRDAIYQQSDEMQYEPADRPSCPAVIRGWMYCGRWSPDNILGSVRNVTYRDIAITADEGIPMPEIGFYGADREHSIAGVTLEGITFNGVPVKPTVSKNEFTDDIRVL